MSTFDSSPIKSGSKFNVDTNISYINMLACHYETATYSGAPTPSTTSSWIATASLTKSFSSDEILNITGILYFSCSTAATQGRTAIFVGGSPLGSDYSFACAATGTSGNADFRTITKTTTTSGGSIPINLSFSYNTGGGTVYVIYAELHVMAFKYRPS